MIGQIFVREQLITRQQLKEVLELQKQQDVYLPMGELAVSEGLVSRTDLNKVLKIYGNSIRLGELLMKRKKITQGQLMAALDKQKSTKRKLGNLLIEMGHIDEDTLADALSIQLGIPKITPSLDLIDTSLLKKFDPELLHKHQFIPAFKDGNDLTVIMSNPQNKKSLELLQRISKCNVVVAVASASQIQKTINIFHKKSEPNRELSTLEPIKDLVLGRSDLLQNSSDKIDEMVRYIISDAIITRASDIHIEPQDKFLRVRFRIDGVLKHKTDLPNAVAQKLISRLKAVFGLDIAEKRKPQHSRIPAKAMNKQFDLRVSTYAAIWGENVVIKIRSRQSEFIDVEKIGLSPSNRFKYIDALETPSGIILITGPTGSGKSTTLYASLRYLNKMDRVIMTVEDPVEYTIDGVVQANVSPKIGLNYRESLKAMMSQDPDVLMIGEIDDAHTAEALFQAALCGHRILSTLHTEDAAEAIARLEEMGIEPFLISSTLVAVVAQRLVRVLCKNCKEPYRPSKQTFAFFKTIENPGSDDYHFFKSKGCSGCNQSGFKGMTAIHEVLLVNDAVRDEILNGSAASDIKRIARHHAGMVTMSEDGFYKALKGTTALEEIIRVLYKTDPKKLEPISIDEIIRRSCKEPGQNSLSN